MVADALSGDPAVLEPDKWERWEWFDWKTLPSPLFLPVVNLVAQGFDPINMLSVCQNSAFSATPHSN